MPLFSFPSSQPLYFGRLFLLNISLFVLAGFAIFFSLHIPETTAFLILKQSLLLLIALPLTALNLTAILEKLANKSLGWLEKILTATILGLTLPPLFTTLFFTLFDFATPSLPFFLTLGSFLIAVSINPQFLDRRVILNRNESWIFCILSFLTFLFSFMTVRAFYALPDLDPYYWLSLYQGAFTQGLVTPLHLYRPLFSSLSYIFVITSGVDSYAYFKYVLPFCSLLLLFPLALLASHFKDPVAKVLVYFLPFVTASFVLYSHTPIPQAILNIGLVLFCITMLHSFFTRDTFFLFLSGFLLLGLSFYHEAASILGLIWLLTVVVFYRQSLKTIYQKNPLLVTLLCVLILLQALSLSGNLFQFIFYWINRILFLLQWSAPNFSYPATYTNIDGMTVGWITLTGVLHYYAFYAGPLFFASVVASILIFHKSLVKRQTLVQPESVILLLASVFFLSIAEVLPRLFNIALLPERALGFATLFSVTFLLLLLHSLNGKILRLSSSLLIGFFLINIGGALYINNLKQYLITPAQITSAHWLRSSLANNAIIMSYGNENLLRVHAQATVFKSNDPLFYSNLDSFVKLYQEALFQQSGFETSAKHYSEGITHSLKNIKIFAENNNQTNLIKEVQDIEKASSSFLNTLEASKTIPSDTPNSVYVYYARTSPQNPYAKRPYIAGAEEAPVFIFDQRSDFKRIYTHPHDEIVIWQYLPSL